MLDQQLTEDSRREQRVRAPRPEVPTRWVLERVIVLLVAAAALLAIGALAQVLGNHAHGASLKPYYYADAVIEAVAYACAAAAFFIGWLYSNRSSAFRTFSLPLMLAFLGAACITVQWTFVLLTYFEEFSFNPAYAQSIRNLVDASAMLQLLGWGAIAAALAVTLRIFMTGSSRTRAAADADVQWWHHGPTRAP
jgi:hypothetical protein